MHYSFTYVTRSPLPPFHSNLLRPHRARALPTLFLFICIPFPNRHDGPSLPPCMLLVAPNLAFIDATPIQSDPSPRPHCSFLPPFPSSPPPSFIQVPSLLRNAIAPTFYTKPSNTLHHTQLSFFRLVVLALRHLAHLPVLTPSPSVYMSFLQLRSPSFYLSYTCIVLLIPRLLLVPVSVPLPPPRDASCTATHTYLLYTCYADRYI
ncbi:hypothetical protein R3P38DRAFT_1102716 [Favolaschia claudopus]|uniref:Uncharacterized protein n=1 Tax=Favolaschia claudopus TaxID=2862362 RepID=A0AAW0BBQ9_9AGAR